RYWTIASSPTRTRSGHSIRCLVAASRPGDCPRAFLPWSRPGRPNRLRWRYSPLPRQMRRARDMTAPTPDPIARRIWFWQSMVSPQMAERAVALTRLGCEVTYVAEQAMLPERALQGWTLPDMPGVRLAFAPSIVAARALVANAAAD